MEQLTWARKNNTLPEEDVRRNWRAVDINELQDKFNANVVEIPDLIEEAAAAKIADSITEDVTTSAPNQAKVFDALADKASHQYVDDAALGFISSWKTPVRLKTTGNVTLSGEQTLDGSLTATDDVLVGSNTNQAENGIYTTAAGAWTRRADANTAIELEGAAVTVLEGATQANTNWIQQTDNITIGTSNIVWGPLGQNAPDASPINRGIARLYIETGPNTDGSMDQNSITNALAGKAATIDAMPFGATAGNNSYTVAMSPTVTAYTNGRLYHVRVGTTNTAGVTFSFDGLAAKKAFRTDGVQASAGHFIAGVDYLVAYNSSLDGGAGGLVAVNELQHGFMNTRAMYSGNAYPSAGGSGVGGAIRQGDTFVMSATHTLSVGVVANAGDMLFTMEDNPGQTASLWFVIPGRQSLALKVNLTSFVKKETPGGSVPGTDFTTAFPLVPNSEELFINGILQDLVTSYTITGQNIVLVTALEVEDSLKINYIKS